MRGGAGITKAITDLLAAGGLELPPWAAPAVGLVLMVALMPWILRNMRTSQARKLAKRATFEWGQARDDMEREAISLVSNNPVGLLALAEEFARRGRYPLAREALAALPEGVPKLQRERRRLMEQMAPREPATPEAAVLVVERMLAEGMREEAGNRLTRARRRWPDSEQLASLQQQLFSP